MVTAFYALIALPLLCFLIMLLWAVISYYFEDRRHKGEDSFFDDWTVL